MVATTTKNKPVATTTAAAITTATATATTAITTLEDRQSAYQPRGAALEAFRCKAPEVLLDGPAGTGKSRCWLEKLHAVGWKYPNSRQLIVRKTRKSITQTAMVTFDKKVRPPGSQVKFHTTDQVYKYPNGSVIGVGGIDDPIKIMSSEWDIIYVMEATELSLNDWESLNTRLRNGIVPYQQLIADCNPGPPSHWLNQRCNSGLTVRFRSRHEDNPSITEAYLNVLKSLTGVRRKRLYEGQWAAAEGLVYPDFDRETHVLGGYSDLPGAGSGGGGGGGEIPPPEWTRYRVIDFGYQHPFVCQWWAVDGEGRLYMYREVFGTQRLVEDWAKDIAELSRGERIKATITDHDAEGRATLEKYLNCQTTKAHKDVSPGIQAVQARLRPTTAASTVGGGDGKPRIFFMADALVKRDSNLDDRKAPASTIEEFDSYIWDTTANGSQMKDVPVKLLDDGMDCMRYMVAYLDLNPGSGIFDYYARRASELKQQQQQ